MMDFLTRINKDILLLDGAMGTMLAAKGFPSGVPPDMANITHSGMVLAVQKEYIAAGSEALLTNTFGANRFKLRRARSEGKVEEINAAGVRLAREALNGRGYVLGDIGPTGELIEPAGEIKLSDVYEVFREQAGIIEKAGADAVVIETMMDINEAVAAVRATAENTELPVIGSITFQHVKDGYRTIMGVDVAAAVKKLTQCGCAALGANCTLAAAEMEGLIIEMRKLTALSIIAQPNAGSPKLVNGETVFEETPEAFAGGMARIKAAGATLLGGCCGTTPEHISKMKAILRKGRH